MTQTITMGINKFVLMANESQTSYRPVHRRCRWWRSHCCVRNKKEWGPTFAHELFRTCSSSRRVITEQHRGDGKYSFSLSLFLVRCRATNRHPRSPSPSASALVELMRFSTSPRKKRKTSPSRSTNTLWQFNYNIPFFQLVLFLPIFPFPFLAVLHRCCYFPITLTRLRWHWCVHVYTVCSSVHQQAIHVVSHTCKERKEEKWKWKEFVSKSIIQLCMAIRNILFVSLLRFGGWVEMRVGRARNLCYRIIIGGRRCCCCSRRCWYEFLLRLLVLFSGCIQS